MTVDEVMKMTDEELMLKVAEIQGHKNLKWTPMPLDDTEQVLFDEDTHQPILSPVNNIVAAWDLWREMNYSEPCMWAIFGESDVEISIEYFGWDYTGDRQAGTGLWAIDGPDTITITRAYILYRTNTN